MTRAATRLTLALLFAAGGWAAPAWAQKASEVRSDMSVRTLYLLRCGGCHGAGGAGAPDGGVPTFPGSIGELAGDAEGRAYIVHVPGVAGSGLSDAQTAEVLNYILTRWGGDRRPLARFTAEEVRRHRARPFDDVVAARRRIAQRLSRRGVKVAAYPWP